MKTSALRALMEERHTMKRNGVSPEQWDRLTATQRERLVRQDRFDVLMSPMTAKEESEPERLRRMTRLAKDGIF